VSNTRVTSAAGALRDKIRGEMTVKRCQQLATTLLSDLAHAQKWTAEAKFLAQKSPTEAKLSPTGPPAVSPSHERELTDREGAHVGHADGGRSPRDRPLNISQLSRCTCGGFPAHASASRKRADLDGLDGGGGARGAGHEQGIPLGEGGGGRAAGGVHDDSANKGSGDRFWEQRITRSANKGSGDQQGCEEAGRGELPSDAARSVLSESASAKEGASQREAASREAVAPCGVRREPSGLSREARGDYSQGGVDVSAGQSAEVDVSGRGGRGGWGRWLVGLLLVGVVRLLLRRGVFRSASVLLLLYSGYRS